MIRLPDAARVSLAGLSIFVTGVVVGCAADRSILNPPSYAAARNPTVDVRDHHEAVLAELRTELALSPEQATRVEEIFSARQAEVEAAWAQVHANLQRAMQQTTSEIESVLDASQVARLRAWMAERHGKSHGHSPRQH